MLFSQIFCGVALLGWLAQDIVEYLIKEILKSKIAMIPSFL